MYVCPSNIEEVKGDHLGVILQDQKKKKKPPPQIEHDG